MTIASIGSVEKIQSAMRSQETALNRAVEMAQKASGAQPARDPSSPSFAERLGASMQSVADAQNDASQMRRAYELGEENDLSKVMVAQQVSSLGFQLALNVRNKALTAYKDIMNMPV